MVKIGPIRCYRTYRTRGMALDICQPPPRLNVEMWHESDRKDVVLPRLAVAELYASILSIGAFLMGSFAKFDFGVIVALQFTPETGRHARC